MFDIEEILFWFNTVNCCHFLLLITIYENVFWDNIVVKTVVHNTSLLETYQLT